MSGTEPDWASYLNGVASFAGTLFALVLAARQIRNPLVDNAHPRVSRAIFVDSIAVTVELGAAASLAVLYEIRMSPLFSAAVGLVALSGVGLSAWSAASYWNARKHARGRQRLVALLQWAGNLLPLTCYIVSALYAARAFDFKGGETWGYAAAVSWLTFSGIFQSIWWYSRIWVEAATAHSVEA